MSGNDIKKLITRFFGVVAQRQTYLNLTYLLFSFPLGTAYFIFLVTGLSMGLSLSITLIGLPILLLMLFAWWELASFERQLAIWLLGVNIQPMICRNIGNLSIMGKMKEYILNPVTWKGLVFLFIKFPLGILTLIVSFTLIMFTLVFISSPILYKFSAVGFDIGGYIMIESFSESLVLMLFGVVLGIISLHIMNGLARLSGILAQKLLGNVNSSMNNENYYTNFNDFELDDESEYEDLEVVEFETVNESVDEDGNKTRASVEDAEYVEELDETDVDVDEQNEEDTVHDDASDKRSS